MKSSLTTLIFLLFVLSMYSRSYILRNSLLKAVKWLPSKAINRALLSNVARPAKELSIYGENSLVENVYGSLSTEVKGASQFSQGQLVKAKVIKITNLGATLVIEGTKKIGVILSNDLDIHNEGKDWQNHIRVGNVLDVFISFIDKSGKLFLSLRPSVTERISSTRDLILNALQLSPSGELPVGDKSSPEDIAKYFHGISKSDFKNAVGKLMKEQLVQPGPHAIVLRSDEEIKQSQQQQAVKQLKEKTHFIETKPAHSVFLGNLPLSVDETDIASVIDAEVGFDMIEDIRLVRNPVTQASRGFAYVEFKTQSMAMKALRQLRGSSMFGRKIRVNRAERNTTIVKVNTETADSTPISELKKVLTKPTAPSEVPNKSKELAVADSDSEEENSVSEAELQRFSDLIPEDFDPEREFYVVSEKSDMQRISSHDNNNNNYEEGEGAVEEEEEPTDYNDVNLYKPKQKQQQEQQKQYKAKQRENNEAVRDSSRGSGRVKNRGRQ